MALLVGISAFQYQAPNESYFDRSPVAVGQSQIKQNQPETVVPLFGRDTSHSQLAGRTHRLPTPRTSGQPVRQVGAANPTTGGFGPLQLRTGTSNTQNWNGVVRMATGERPVPPEPAPAESIPVATKQTIKPLQLGPNNAPSRAVPQVAANTQPQASWGYHSGHQPVTHVADPVVAAEPCPSCQQECSACNAGFDCEGDCFPPVCGDVVGGGCRQCCKNYIRDRVLGERYKCRSTCNMPPHYPYYPANHGYYYFRPYNYTHIFAHQAIAPVLGEDPTSPYGSSMFDRLYADMLLDGYEQPGMFRHDINPIPRRTAPGLPDLQSILLDR